MSEKKKAGKKDAVKKEGRIPKRVAGVKVPKEVRRRGEALIEAAGSPHGREVIARGLTVAATLANLAVQRGRPAAASGAEPEPAVGEVAEAGAAPSPAPPLDPQKLAEAVTTVADAVLGRLFPGKKA